MNRSPRFIYMNPSSKRTRLPYRAFRVCANPRCKARNPPTWRTGPNGETWCNKCGLQYSRRTKKNKATIPMFPISQRSLPSNANSLVHIPAYSFGSLFSPQELPNAAQDASTTEFLNIPACDNLSNNSGLVTSEPNILLLDSDGQLDTVSLSAGYGVLEGHEPDNAGQLFGYGDLTEDSSTLNIFPALTQVRENDDPTLNGFQLDDIPVRAETDNPEFDPVQDADGINHKFCSIQQDAWTRRDIDHITFPHNQDVTQTGHASSMLISSTSQASGFSETPYLQTNQSLGRESLIEGLRASLASSRIFEIPRESCYASPLSGQGTRVLVEHRRRPGTSGTGIMSLQSPLPVCGLSCRNSCLPDTQQNGSHTLNYCHRSSGLDNIEEGQCTCWRQTLRIFCSHDDTILKELSHDVQKRLLIFFQRAALVHFKALSNGSSLFSATERFIYDNAGEDLMITAFAILREDLELVQSSSRGRSIFSAATCDLAFDHVVTGAPEKSTPPDDWLHGQLLAQYVSSERAKTAIWDLSRLLPGCHVPDSTFQWLRRTFVVVETRSGPQITMNIQSGSDEYRFRGFYEIYEQIKYANIPERRASLEPALQEACVKCCQEWFIAVLDEAAKRPTEASQLEFLELNKMYMINCVNILTRTFRKMNINRALHVCFFNCNSHVQPSFRSLRQAAHDALRNLFSPPRGLLGYIRESPETYPTQEQLFLCRIVGLTQHKLYFTSKLLSKNRQREHALHTLSGLMKLRAELVQKTGANTIWNYLPVDIAQRAAAKRESAIAFLD